MDQPGRGGLRPPVNAELRELGKATDAGSAQDQAHERDTLSRGRIHEDNRRPRAKSLVQNSLHPS